MKSLFNKKIIYYYDSSFYRLEAEYETNWRVYLYTEHDDIKEYINKLNISMVTVSSIKSQLLINTEGLENILSLPLELETIMIKIINFVSKRLSTPEDK